MSILLPDCAVCSALNVLQLLDFNVCSALNVLQLLDSLFSYVFQLVNRVCAAWNDCFPPALDTLCGHLQLTINC